MSEPGAKPHIYKSRPVWLELSLTVILFIGLEPHGSARLDQVARDRSRRKNQRRPAGAGDVGATGDARQRRAERAQVELGACYGGEEGRASRGEPLPSRRGGAAPAARARRRVAARGGGARMHGGIWGIEKLQVFTVAGRAESADRRR